MSELYYREVRGSMTKFEKLTLELAVNEGISKSYFEELCSIIENLGLSTNFIIHDNSRIFQNTFYADYKQGLYCEIYLKHETKKANFYNLEYLSKKRISGNENLKNKNWEEFYSLDVPVPMLIYDFQRRYRDIETSNVFKIWYKIYKRIDYSNNMWDFKILDYIFQYTPLCTKPIPNSNNMVTLYRGGGELSLPIEKAISWSTHPCNALWFSNHYRKRYILYYCRRKTRRYYLVFSRISK